MYIVLIHADSLKMWFFQKESKSPEWEVVAKHIAEQNVKIRDLEDRMDKLEIKALESRKQYKKKLNQLYGDKEEGDKKEEGLNSSVLLPG